MIATNLPAIRKVATDGYYKLQVFSKKTWVRMSFSTIFVMLIASSDLRFKIPPSVHSNRMVKTQNNLVEKEKIVTADLNPLHIANPATATSEALTEAEKAQAAQLSNLGLFVNEGYAKRHGISDKVWSMKRKKCEDYIRFLAPAAIEQAKKYQIPASITIAQGLLETNAGDSRLAKENNNHFGIKCFSTNCKRGHCTNMTDDSHKDFFRKYATISACLEDRSAFLQKGRYKTLYSLDKKDYKGWAKGLKAAGYATAPNYAESLIAVVDAFELYIYDK